MKRTTGLWLLFGLFGYAILPWYALKRGFWSFEWVPKFGDALSAPALFEVLNFGRFWLAPAGLALLVAGLLLLMNNPVKRARFTGLAALVGLFMTALQGLIIVRGGPRILEGFFTFGGMEDGQRGFGAGAFVVLIALLFVLTTAISGMGKGRGDAFVVGLIGLIIALVGVFVFFPVVHILIRAFETPEGFSLTAFLAAPVLLRYLGPWLPNRHLLRAGHQLCGAGHNDRRHDDPTGPRLRTHLYPHKLSRQKSAAPAHRYPHRHPAFCDRPCAHPAFWPHRRHYRDFCQPVRR